MPTPTADQTRPRHELEIVFIFVCISVLIITPSLNPTRNPDKHDCHGRAKTETLSAILGFELEGLVVIVRRGLPDLPKHDPDPKIAP
jgi:hypothetical protein